MRRITELDLPNRLAPAVPILVTQIAFGLLCAATTFVVRTLLDVVAPGSAPFALMYPAITLATLFGRWQAGATTAIISLAYILRFLYPLGRPALPGAPPAAINVAVVVVASIVLIAVAETFRRAVRRATAERDREIAERDLFLEEFDHRVKNNFAVVASLLELQRRRSDDPGTQEALGIALSRVESIARAHRHLYRGGSTANVEMRDYLADLCAALADALFLHGTIQLRCSADAAPMPRDRAVSIGLVVNELVTNAVKHAFTGRDRGTITVEFRKTATGATLTVTDDGGGLPPPREAADDSGLGSKLVEAFARQAGGTLRTDSDPTGTRVTLTLA